MPPCCWEDLLMRPPPNVDRMHPLALPFQLVVDGADPRSPSPANTTLRST